MEHSHGDDSLTARVLEHEHVLEIPATGGTLLSNVAAKGHTAPTTHSTSDGRVNRDLRATIERYKVRELQTFAFQQRLLDEASERATLAEARLAELDAALASVPSRIQAAVAETREHLLKDIEALSAGVAARDAELARLSHHNEEVADLVATQVWGRLQWHREVDMRHVMFPCRPASKRPWRASSTPGPKTASRCSGELLPSTPPHALRHSSRCAQRGWGDRVGAGARSSCPT